MKRSTSKTCDAIIRHEGKTFVSVDALIDAAAFPIVKAPFYGSFIVCIVRELNKAQLDQCGKFSMIETVMDRIAKRKKVSSKQISEYTKLQHNVCRKTLISPTYDEIIHAAGVRANVADIEKQIDDVYESTRTLRPGKELNELQNEITRLQLWSKYLLPSEFTSFIFSYAIGIDKSDIREITEEMLLDAAILASRGNDNPADHIGGYFTDHNREDINTRAWILYTAKYEKKKDKKRVGQR